MQATISETNQEIAIASAQVERAIALVMEAERNGLTAILPQLKRSLRRRADRLAEIAFGA